MAGKKFINAKLKGYNELQEILVEDGVFKAIAPHIDVDSDCEIEDLGGKLTLPPYVDPHIHLDYVFTARKQGMYPQHKYNYKMLLKQHKMLVTLKQMLVVCYIDCYSQTILINAI